MARVTLNRCLAWLVGARASETMETCTNGPMCQLKLRFRSGSTPRGAGTGFALCTPLSDPLTRGARMKRTNPALADRGVSAGAKPIEAAYSFVCAAGMKQLELFGQVRGHVGSDRPENGCEVCASEFPAQQAVGAAEAGCVPRHHRPQSTGACRRCSSTRPSESSSGAGGRLIWRRHQREQAGPSARGADSECAPDFGNALAH